MLQWSYLGNSLISFALSLGAINNCGITGLKGTKVFKTWKELEASCQFLLPSATYRSPQIAACVPTWASPFNFFPLNSQINTVLNCLHLHLITTRVQDLSLIFSYERWHCYVSKKPYWALSQWFKAAKIN